jgi:hypothetical protein
VPLRMFGGTVRLRGAQPESVARGRGSARPLQPSAHRRDAAIA